jgi:hypothetical protein
VPKTGLSAPSHRLDQEDKVVTPEAYWQSFHVFFENEMRQSEDWRIAWRNGTIPWSKWFEPRLGKLRVRVENCYQPREWVEKWRSGLGVKSADLRVFIGYSADVAADLRRAAGSKTVLKKPGPNLLIVGPLKSDSNGRFHAWEWRDGDFVLMQGELTLP